MYQYRPRWPILYSLNIRFNRHPIGFSSRAANAYNIDMLLALRPGMGFLSLFANYLLPTPSPSSFWTSHIVSQSFYMQPSTTEHIMW